MKKHGDATKSLQKTSKQRSSRWERAMDLTEVGYQQVPVDAWRGSTLKTSHILRQKHLWTLGLQQCKSFPRRGVAACGIQL